jgi:hypothetical protein
MRQRLSSLSMEINRPPCDENFDSAGSRLEASICSGHGSLHPELLNS